jgi:hypothetical protein
MSLEPRSFLCAPGLKIESQAQLTTLQFAQLHAQLAKIEGTMERLEKRLWLTVYGVVAVVLSQGILSVLKVVS